MSGLPLTTVAASWKTKTIACDRQFTHSAGVTFKGSTKIVTLSDEVAKEMFGVKKGYIGFCGNADIWGEVVSYLAVPEGKPPKIKDIELLMLNDMGIWHGTNLKNWMRIDEHCFAIGSGMHFALSAMESGKTPIEACRVAGKWDRSTGLGYKEYSL